MKTKELDLTPIREFMHEIAYYPDGYHVDELSVLFRKIAIELAFSVFSQQRTDGCIDMGIEDYIYKLEYLAKKLDEVDRIYNEH